MGLSISVEQNGDKHILRLKGKMDAQTLPALEREIEALFEAKHKKVLLNLAKIEGVSSDCLQMLNGKTKKFTGINGILGLCNISDDLMEAIQTTGLKRCLLIYSNEREALKAMV